MDLLFPLRMLVLKDIAHGIEDWVLWMFDEIREQIRHRRSNSLFKMLEEDPFNFSEGTDTAEVIFDDKKAFISFTVMLVSDQEEQYNTKSPTKDNTQCYCAEQCLVGSTEVQEWKVELDDDDDDSLSVALPSQVVNSDTGNGRLGLAESADSVTDHRTMSLSPRLPPNDTVTLYSLSETTDVEVSFTFQLMTTKTQVTESETI